MNCKLEMPNGVKMECNEGVEKLFNLYKNLNDFGLITKSATPSERVVGDSTIQEELKKYMERCKKLTDENALLKGENENLTTQLLGIQNDTTDLDFLHGEVERLEKVESDLKAKLQTQKEDYEKEIDKLKKQRDDLVKQNEEKELQPNENKNIIIAPKVENIETTTPKIEIPSNNKEDFNPNNAKDLAWLQEQLGGKKEEAEPISNNREMIDGYYVERNAQNQIYKINDIELQPAEIMGLQYHITTVGKMMENKKMMANNDKAIVHGWDGVVND